MSRINIYTNICKGCTFCINVCPRKVLALSDDFNVKGNHYVVMLDQEKCAECGMCTEICPDAALELLED